MTLKDMTQEVHFFQLISIYMLVPFDIECPNLAWLYVETGIFLGVSCQVAGPSIPKNFDAHTWYEKQQPNFAWRSKKM